MSAELIVGFVIVLLATALALVGGVVINREPNVRQGEARRGEVQGDRNRRLDRPVDVNVVHQDYAVGEDDGEDEAQQEDPDLGVFAEDGAPSGRDTVVVPVLVPDSAHGELPAVGRRECGSEQQDGEDLGHDARNVRSEGHSPIVGGAS